MIYSLIGNKVELAAAGLNAGINRIMVDIERIGKDKRQANKHLFYSDHQIEDILPIKKYVPGIDMVLRINSIGSTTEKEVIQAIAYKVSYIMLPYFKTMKEVDTLIQLTANKIGLIVLVETKEAVALLDQLVAKDEIAEIHFGLNDLAISYGYQNIFEPIKSGAMDSWCAQVQPTHKPYGFGGMSSLSNNGLPVLPELIIAEQIRLGCTRAWLGRSFKNMLNHNYSNLHEEMHLLKQKVAECMAYTTAEKNKAHQTLLALIY